MVVMYNKPAIIHFPTVGHMMAGRVDAQILNFHVRRAFLFVEHNQHVIPALSNKHQMFSIPTGMEAVNHIMARATRYAIYKHLLSLTSCIRGTPDYMLSVPAEYRIRSQFIRSINLPINHNMTHAKRGSIASLSKKDCRL